MSTIGAVQAQPTTSPDSSRVGDKLIPLLPDILKLHDQYQAIWFLPLPDGYTFEDCFQPALFRRLERKWVSQGKRGPKVGDLVRIRGPENSFDCLFTIEEVEVGISSSTGGYRLAFFTGRLPKVE